jgi:Nif-specific regulatory protein
MNPRLIAIAGPLKGVIFRMTEDEISIGREPFNQFCISDTAVSRRHCTLSRANDQIILTDHDSRNGTFVNGLPIKQRRLEQGDGLRIGDHHFVFLLREEEITSAITAVQFEDAPPPSGATLTLSRDASFYHEPEKLFADAPAPARLKRELDVFLKISAAISGLRRVEELQRRLLELIFEAIPAERGATLLTGRQSEEFSSVCGQSRRPPGWPSGREDDSQPIHVSRTVVAQVMREGVAVLTNEVSENQDFSAAPSLLASKAHSLMAVPLLRFDRALGLIYLDASDPAVKFDEGHLRLMTAIAGIAAAAFEQAQRFEWLESEAERLREEINVEHGMIGESRRMRDVYKFIAKVAPAETTVLIRGESGTGKELVARAIHRHSPRAAKPFVAINCAALTETLLESELFGHEKGAFTGAAAQKKGKLEVADGGTVFLDELGEMSTALQAKLLRALQEREFERVGGTRPLKVDIRLIAATNRDLEADVRRGGFRADLYYRLNVVSIVMPPLRERREDIPLLASYFAVKYGQRCKRPIKGLAPEARAALQRYDWPGNVRELENAIERAVVLGSTEVILTEDLPETVLDAVLGAVLEGRSDGQSSTSGAMSYFETLKETKKRLVLEALDRAQGNHNDAARLLGMHPNNLHRLMKSLDLKKR